MMTLRMIWPCAVLILGFSASSGLAQECTGWFDIHDLHDIERSFANCTVVDGTVAILPYFSGPLVLPDIVNITGAITINAESNVTSVKAPDLVSVGSLDFGLEGTVSLVSFPRLEIVGERISMGASLRNSTIELPFLTNAGSVSLKGSFGSLDLNALRFVSDDLTIHNEVSTLKPLELLFPALENAGFIKVSGDISSIFMAELLSVGPLDDSLGSIYPVSGLQLHLEQAEGPFQLEFPKLSSIDSELYVHGAIESLDLSALKYTEATIHIDTSHPLAITSYIVSASAIELYGAIEAATFPSLGSRFISITLSSTLDLDCEEFTKSVDTTWLDLTDQSVTCTSSSSFSPSSSLAVISTQSATHHKRARRRRSSKIPTAVFILIPIVAVIVLGACCCSAGSRKSEESTTAAAAAASSGVNNNVNINIRLDPRGGGGSGDAEGVAVPLPVYPGYQNQSQSQSRYQEGSGVATGEGEVLPPPPPYSPYSATADTGRVRA
ncbi:hypothetical protein BDV12DRAFT_179018 [Aspergillus spectabilis]